jgi:hypothetical protein
MDEPTRKPMLTPLEALSIRAQGAGVSRGLLNSGSQVRVLPGAPSLSRVSGPPMFGGPPILAGFAHQCSSNGLAAGKGKARGGGSEGS